MALPSAQLGSLPSMQVPYQIPRYEKPAGLLERALAGFLANVATQAGGQLASNAFARDYGNELGGEDASFLSKLFQGPSVGQQEYNAQMDQRRKLEELGVRGQIDLANTELQDFLARGRDATNANMSLQASDLANDRAVNNEIRQQIAQVRQQNRQLANQTELEQLKAQIERDSPQGQYYQAQAEGQQIQNNVLRGMHGQQTGGNISPEDAAAVEQLLKEDNTPPPTTIDLQDFIGNYGYDDVNLQDTQNQVEQARLAAEQNKLIEADKARKLAAISQIDPMLAARMRFNEFMGSSPNIVGEMTPEELKAYLEKKWDGNGYNGRYQ